MNEIIEEASLKATIKSTAAQLNAMKDALVKKLADKYRDANDIYIKSKVILEQDKKLWYSHRHDLVSFDAPSAMLYDDIKNKWYNLKVDLVFCDPDVILNYIDSIDKSSKSVKDRYAYLEKEVDKEITAVRAYFNQHFSFAQELEPKVNVTPYKDISIKNVLSYAKATIEDFKDNSTVVSDQVIKVQLILIQLLDKAYYSMENKYKSDPKALKIYTKIFAEILEEENILLDFDSKLLNTIDEAFEKLYQELNKVYNKIKS